MPLVELVVGSETINKDLSSKQIHFFFFCQNTVALKYNCTSKTCIYYVVETFVTVFSGSVCQWFLCLPKN